MNKFLFYKVPGFIMSSNNESLYSHILRTYHGDDVRKRKKTVLFKDIPKTINDLITSQEGWNPASARINQKNLKRMVGLLSNEARIILIFRLIIYLYIKPFLRFSLIVFLILFRYYHFTHPETISARMNESFLIRSVWSNYYTNPDFLTRTNVNTNTNTNTKNIGIQLKGYANEDLKPSVNATSTLHITDSSTTKKNNSSIKIQISNSSKQVVFVNNNTSKKRLLRPVVTSLNNTMMLVDFTTPLVSSSIPPSSLSKKVQKPEIKSILKSQITVSNPMASTPKSLNSNKKTIDKIKHLNIKNKKNSKKNSKQIRKFDINDFVYGYVIVDKKLVVIYENGVPYFYKVSQAFIDKYF